MPRDNQAYTPVSIAAPGCQKVVPYRGEVRGGGVGSCCVGVDFVNYPKNDTREMGKVSENYPKHDTRMMGSLLSSHIAFDAKREDTMEFNGMGRLVNVIDGDNVRQGVCRDLSFSPYHHEGGRAENLRRISEMIRLFLDAGVRSDQSFLQSHG